MSSPSQLKLFATRRLTSRLTRAIPWVGAAIALVTLGSSIRRKGFFGGALDTALDFTPGVGTVKNLAEAARGRDFIIEKAARERRRAARLTAAAAAGDSPIPMIPGTREKTQPSF